MEKSQLVVIFSGLVLASLAACSTPTAPVLTSQERAEGERIEAMIGNEEISARMTALAKAKFTDVEPFPSGARIQPPHPTLQVPPVYPFEMRKAGRQGIVWLGVVVGKEGNIERLEVLSGDQPAFNFAAAQAVRRWQFRPATADGKPVRAILCFPLTFTLEDPRHS